MSVLNSDVLDGVAHNNGELVMLISDHLDWSNEGEHLLALQDKINAYIAFWETMQYKKIYHGCSFASAKIELHEKYDPSPNFYIIENSIQNGQTGYYVIADREFMKSAKEFCMRQMKK